MIGRQVINTAHVSMQFSDSRSQMEKDVRRIFGRARNKGYEWITGTEAGRGNPLGDILQRQCRETGYLFAHDGRQDSWIAIRQAFVAGGSLMNHDFDQVDDGKAHEYGPRGVQWARFRNHNIGTVTVMASHYVTRGQPGDDNDREIVNRKVAAQIGRRGREFGGGSGLVFYAGDQNINDKKDDTFFGAPFTSLWDELNKYEGTIGEHVPIDVMASYNHDGRVTGRSINAFNDRMFQLNTDHFLIEGSYYVRLLLR